VTLPADAVSQLAQHPNIVGMKESGGDVTRIAELVGAAPPPFALLGGSGATFCAALEAGAAGGVLVLASVLPEACSRLFALARDRRFEEARALQARLRPVAQLLGSTYGIPGVKAALNLVGYDVGEPRSPLAPAPEAARAAIREALSAFEEVAA